MTIIVWTPKGMAADKQAVNTDVRFSVCKLHTMYFDGKKVCVGICGDFASGMMMLDWFKRGADLAKYPECQKTDNWARLVVGSAEGCYTFEQTPVPMYADMPQFVAWGIGKGVAYGALHMGADAIQAVEAACKYVDGCGNGIDYVEF